MNQHHVPAPVSPESIFIHSLFRAGSTYLFNVFRKNTKYWCYQEPLNELAFCCKEDKERLLETSNEVCISLRHPHLDKPYFFELYEVADSCLPYLQKGYIHDTYFVEEGDDVGIQFFKALIAAAKATPVIQECRTSMRIKVLKDGLGGSHLFLWRNPWDQWWSYKVTDYFDIASQLSINGKSTPKIISRLRQELAFSEFQSDDVLMQIKWFSNHRLVPEKNYLLFYTLWLLALQYGVKNADVLINIDRLSCDVQYRQQVTDALAEKGITGLDFSDCQIPQARYGKADAAFFRKIEDNAHELFLYSGTPQRELDSLLQLRHSSEPDVWTLASLTLDESALLRDAERMRVVVRRIEEREVSAQAALHAAEAQAQQGETLAQRLEGEVHQAQEQLQSSEQKAVDAEQRAVDAEQRAEAAEQRAEAAEQRAVDAEQRAAALLHSTSWRITQPLRGIRRVLRGDFGPFVATIKNGLKKRVK